MLTNLGLLVQFFLQNPDSGGFYSQKKAPADGLPQEPCLRFIFDVL